MLGSRRIAVRIFIGYLLLLLFFSVVGIILPYFLTTYLDRAVRNYAQTASFVDDAYALRRAALDSENDLRGFLLYGDEAFREQFATSRSEYRQRYRQMEEFTNKQSDINIGTYLTLSDVAYRRWLTKFATPEFAAADRSPFNLRTAAVARAAAKRSSVGFAGVQQAQDRLVQAALRYREQQLRRARYSERLRTGFTVVAPLAAIFIAVILARFFTIGITRPLDELRVAAEELERGDNTRMLLENYPHDDDEIGDLGRAFGRMARTIGEREAILRAQNEAISAIGRRIEAVLNSTNDGIVLLDSSGGFSIVNAQFATLFGIDIESIQDQTFDEVGSTFLDRFRNRAGAADRFQEWIADPKAVAEETLEIVAPKKRTLRIYTAPVHGEMDAVRKNDDDADIIGRIFVFRDVTRETIVDRMKTEFVSTVSHELRTPLTAIKGYVDLMIGGKTGELNAVQFEFLTMVQASTRRLTDLINDMLDISRIESGRFSVRKEAVDFLPVVREAVRMLETQADAKQVTLHLEAIDRNKPLHPVRGDRDRIMQVLVNLLSNAIKYTPSGGRVVVTAEQDNGFLTACIADTGIGISAEDQNKLFQKFFRADNRTTREVGGTGLGLAITKAILERMHGTIRVESELGKGSNFYFTLPTVHEELFKRPTAPQPPTAAPTTPSPPMNSSRALLLMVGDNPKVLHPLSSQFRNLSYVLTGAMHYSEAVRRSRDLHPDAAIINVAVTKFNVLGLLYELRSKPETKRMPLFLVSLKEEEEVVLLRQNIVVVPAGTPPLEEAIAIDETDTAESLAARIAEYPISEDEAIPIEVSLKDFPPDNPTASTLALALQERLIHDTPIILHLRDCGAEGKGALISLASPDAPTATPEAIAENVGLTLRSGAGQV